MLYNLLSFAKFPGEHDNKIENLRVCKNLNHEVNFREREKCKRLVLYLCEIERKCIFKCFLNATVVSVCCGVVDYNNTDA